MVSSKVLVLKTELEAKSANQEAAIQLQISLAQIAADKDARIAFATAAGQALGAAKMQIFGDPGTLQSMLGAWQKGTEHGKYVDALVTSTPSEVTGLMKTVAEGLAARFAGKTVNAEELLTAIKEIVPLGKKA